MLACRTPAFSSGATVFSSDNTLQMAGVIHPKTGTLFQGFESGLAAIYPS